MLTDLQKDRVKFHLDYLTALGLLELDRDVKILILNPNEQLALVGTIPDPVPDPVPDTLVVFEGVPIATRTSALGKVEIAFSKLSPDTIDDSLFVEQAGKVTLRGSELAKRRSLYVQMVKYLAQLIGASDPFGERVGW